MYSKQAKGGFCLPCVFFPSPGHRGSDPGILVSRPLNKFNKARELLKKHKTKGYHLVSLERMDDFIPTMTNQQPSILTRLDKSRAHQIEINRQKLASIMKTIVFCGKQNLALRGHRDNITDLEQDADDTTNHGNFLALLRFRVEAGDSILREHISTASRNATYTSSNTQNEIINLLSDQVRGVVISKVQKAKWFCVIADEVTDISNKEQLSLVL